MIETATVEAPRKRGRPRKVVIEPISEPELPPSEPLEIDADATIDDDSRDGIPPYPALPRYSSVERILSVWNGLTPRQQEFGNIYLYREWPKMLLVLVKNRLVNENCNKFGVLDGPITLDKIRHLRRMGKYYIRIVQRVEKPYGQLSQSEPFTIDGNLENIAEMPILDLEKLDRAHPDNASYVRILKLRGTIQVDGSGNEGEEMAAQEVLGDLTKTLLTDRLQQPAAQSQPAAVVDAGVGKELVGLLREQINQNRPAGEQGTVADQLDGLVKLARSMTPAPPPPVDLAPFMDLQKQNNEMVRDMMRKDVERAEAAALKAQQEAAEYKAALPKPKSLREELREMRELQQEYKVAIGGKDPEEEDEKPQSELNAGFWGSLLGSLPVVLKEIRETLRESSIMLYNYKLNGTGGPPLSPITGQPGTEPLAPGAEEQSQEPQLSAEEQAKMAVLQNVVNQLAALAQPMLNHFLRVPAKSGAQFAQFVIENYGPQAFASIRDCEGGRDTILAMIQQYPPVWSQIGPARLPQFVKFLDEFMAYSAGQ